MPHQCVHCGKIYPDAAAALLKGCSCGSHFFFFFKEGDLPKLKEETAELSEEEKIEIEEDVREMVGGIEETKPVILDFESIKVTKPGKFEIDLVKLFKRKPVVYKLEEGKYIIDLASTFQLKKQEKGKKK